MPHTLPSLPYSYDFLEPHIDARTMEIHHTKHHQAYIDKLNAAITGTEFENMTVEDLLRHIQDVPEEKRGAVRNHGGGHANHSLFWAILTNAPGEPEGEFRVALESAFGSVQDFKVQFSEKATNQFGSGWAWLTIQNGELNIENSANQDSPLMEGRTPIMGLDVWEHAYYLKYQNKRPDYVAAFWNIVNWKEIARRFAEAQS